MNQKPPASRGVTRISAESAAEARIAILVVEDDPGDFGLIEAFLRQAGFHGGECTYYKLMSISA